MNDFEMIPGFGVGQLMFGMTRGQVEEVLGEPSVVFDEEDEDNNTKTISRPYGATGSRAHDVVTSMFLTNRGLMV